MADPQVKTNGARSSRVHPRLAAGLGTSKSRLIADRLARWVVSAGGLGIILSILGILVFILIEVWPLTTRPRVTERREIPLPGAPVGALLSDEHRTHVAMLSTDGSVRVLRTGDGKVLLSQDFSRMAAGGAAAASALAPLTGMKVPPESRALSAATRTGRVLLAPVEFNVTFDGQDRVVTPEVKAPVVLEIDPEGRPIEEFAAQIDADGNATAAAELADGTLAVIRRGVEENLLSGETAESVERYPAENPSAPGAINDLVLDADQRNLYGGTADGKLLRWELQDGQPGPVQSVEVGAPVSVLALLIGGRSVVVGQESGAISIWMPVEQDDGSYRMTRVRDFPAHPGAIRAIAPSQRDKGFLALSGDRLGLYFSTSHRTLWTGEPPVEGASALVFTPKADGTYVAGRGKLAEVDIRNPHPETTLQTLFGKVWFEGYRGPEHVWQSTGGTDDFEPKLSLTPLLVGTIKGTIYSMLLAIPLGVLGAMYTSQFMHPVYKRTLKPLIEIMASLPSVVLGFLAGLWLAPRIEQAVPALVLMLVVLPLLVLLAGYLWSLLPRAFRGRFPVGTEAVLFVFVLALGIWLCFEMSSPFEKLAFAGNFQGWLLEATGLPYDQRNAIVVGLAMGFAVIPIIFAIAEDAFSNVPPNLISGSLALGADRWQTVTRVVLPTASPGIFSAIMIGFGRAVGETMIVLMATGNTPIMEWNPFNGFRTLSANIAVEIPEAPHASTLYRTLFLAALLLFIVTFLINTVAELVRQRLRTKYSQL
jgi:phosphate transport system permease protein